MKILVAEDVAVTRRLLEQALVAAGHEVVAVSDGEAAWEAFTSEPVPVVVVDWAMPRMDGLELCRRVRASSTGQRAFVLMLTGRDTSDDFAAAFEAGVDDYMVKPVAPGHVRARMQIAEQRLRIDAARRAAEAELIEARWLAGVGETVLALEHELNNPLAALIGSLELAVDPESSEEELREFVGVSLEQARRLARVVRRLASIRRRPATIERIPGMPMLDVSHES